MQHGAERHQTAVDLGTDAGMADIGVHRISEVDTGRADRQRDDPALRGEDEHLVLFEVGLQVLHEGRGVGDVGLPVDDAVQPVDVAGRAIALVGPVGGDAPFGALVHLLRSDLHLDDLAARADHRGVQALVEVELGHGDVVLEATHHRLVATVDATQRRVAILHRIDDDPDGDEVEDVVELTPLLHHLLVDAPQVLAATRDLGLDVELLQTAADLGDRLGQIHLALGCAGD